MGTKKRQSQKERSSGTCAKLRASTIALIAGSGYANLTTAKIAGHAGVSRGALLHHYPARIDLIVDAAAEVWRGAADEVRKLSVALSRGEVDTDGFVEGIWQQVFRHDAVAMTIDLMSAAKSDRELHSRIAIHQHILFDAYDDIAEQAFAKSGLSHDQRRVMVSLTTCTIRGLKIQQMLHPDAAMAGAIRDALKFMLKNIMHTADSGSLLPEPHFAHQQKTLETI